MAEYVLGPDEDQADVARRLLEAAGDPNHVAWSPRPNSAPHGGVYLIADEVAGEVIAALRGPVAETVDGTPVDDGDEVDEVAEDEADEAVVDDPTTPEDEHAEAMDRAARRRAARKAAAPAAEQKSE